MTTSIDFSLLFWFFLAYFAGSIPFGLIIGKLYSKGDIRTAGSGNIGATNVLRSVGKGPAVLTLLSDSLKGFVVILLASYAVEAHHFLWAIAFFAVMGHCYTVFLGFKGGKGVATALGILLYLSPFLAVALCILWSLIVMRCRIVSIASLIVAGFLPAAIFFLEGISSFWWALAIAIVIIFQHRGNILRLWHGSESMIDVYSNSRDRSGTERGT